MIRLAAIDFERAINLFNEDKPRHLMRESHLRQGKSERRRPSKFFAQAERSADCERQIAYAVQVQRGDFFAKSSELKASPPRPRRTATSSQGRAFLQAVTNDTARRD